ncbi:hypothetical protein K488DRAFT_50698, partial [Vararia minispora EC-137]
LRVLSGLQYELPPHHIPDTLELTINDVSGEMPTHAFAVFPSQTTPNERVAVGVWPVHGNIIAVNCAHLPALPETPPAKPCSIGDKISVPVVKLAVPQPASFQPLLHFLYTKEFAVLFEEIFPCPVDAPNGKPPRVLVREYAEKVAKCDPNDVYKAIGLAHGLWCNACFLGIFDDSLWALLDCAWEILMTAWSLVVGTPTLTPA